VFQASSAAWTLARAVSAVNGGSGGRTEVMTDSSGRSVLTLQEWSSG